MPFAELGEAGDGLYRRLVWLTLLRIVLVTILLAASGMMVLRSGAQDLGSVEQILYGIILATYVASLIYLFVLRSSRGVHRALGYAQICGDVVIAACLVYLTGGAESIIVFMFPLTVVSAAVLLYRRGAIVAAVLSSMGLVVVVLGLNSGLLPPPIPKLAPASIPAPRLLFSLFANISAIFLSAALASYLSEQAQSAREKLSVREHDYLALEVLHECIVRSIADGLVTTDRFGRTTFLNAAAEQLTGIARGAGVGMSIEGLLPALAGRLEGELSAPRFEADHQTGAGEKRRFGFAVTRLLDGQGRNHGFVIAFQDLTGIRAMEEAVRQSERLAAIGAMAAGLAHELRNPLASMTGSIQLLADGRALGEDDQRLMGIVLREADRLNALVTDFLRFARPAPAQLEPVDLGELCDSTLTLFANDPTRRHVEVVTEIERPLPLMADSSQLHQVLWNLLVNAADAMPGGGRVHVTARRTGAHATLAVRDTGSGISPEDLPRIFDPFFTTKNEGTGLGLATVHSIIQAHGGQIGVQSESGHGTTFSVKLPVAAAPAVARSA